MTTNTWRSLRRFSGPLEPPHWPSETPKLLRNVPKRPPDPPRQEPSKNLLSPWRPLKHTKATTEWSRTNDNSVKESQNILNYHQTDEDHQAASQWPPEPPQLLNYRDSVWREMVQLNQWVRDRWAVKSSSRWSSGNSEDIWWTSGEPQEEPVVRSVATRFLL